MKKNIVIWLLIYIYFVYCSYSFVEEEKNIQQMDIKKRKSFETKDFRGHSSMRSIFIKNLISL